MANPDFLLIPHQLILDPSLRPLDRIVYGVVYWYDKMKDGRCFASNAAIAAHCGPDTHPSSVKDSLARLETAGYIRRVFSESNSRSQVIPLISFVGVASNDAGGSVRRRGGVASNDAQSSNSSNKTNYTSASAEDSSEENKAVSELIDAFSKFRPDYRSLFKRPNEREAAKCLIRDPKIGLARVRTALNVLYQNREDQFAPLVDSPLELSRKWAKVYRYVKPKVSNQND